MTKPEAEAKAQSLADKIEDEFLVMFGAGQESEQLVAMIKDALIELAVPRAEVSNDELLEANRKYVEANKRSKNNFDCLDHAYYHGQKDLLEKMGALPKVSPQEFLDWFRSFGEYRGMPTVEQIYNKLAQPPSLVEIGRVSDEEIYMKNSFEKLTNLASELEQQMQHDKFKEYPQHRERIRYAIAEARGKLSTPTTPVSSLKGVRELLEKIKAPRYGLDLLANSSERADYWSSIAEKYRDMASDALKLLDEVGK